MDNKFQHNQKFFSKLNLLYGDMDRAWEKAAAAYGFKCTGCAESCCETEFYHYTYIEKDYLLWGMNTLDHGTIKQVLFRAEQVNKQRGIAEKRNERIRIMCPLNENNLCMIYKFRPMICRLHGIPHELCKPSSEPLISPGCDAGTELFNEKGYIKFDRTPFYSKMAGIEMDYRKAKGKSEKIKQTIAQMLISY